MTNKTYKAPEMVSEREPRTVPAGRSEDLMDKNMRPTQSPGLGNESEKGLGLFIGIIALVAIAIIAASYFGQLLS